MQDIQTTYLPTPPDNTNLDPNNPPPFSYHFPHPLNPPFPHSLADPPFPPVPHVYDRATTQLPYFNPAAPRRSTFSAPISVQQMIPGLGRLGSVANGTPGQGRYDAPPEIVSREIREGEGYSNAWMWRPRSFGVE